MRTMRVWQNLRIFRKLPRDSVTARVSESRREFSVVLYECKTQFRISDGFLLRRTLAHVGYHASAYKMQFAVLCDIVLAKVGCNSECAVIMHPK